MSNQIPESFSEEYASNVEMLLQQQPSRFREAVRVGNYTGRAAEVVQQVGAINLVEKTNRHGDTPIVDTPHNVRWVHPKDEEAGQLIDKQDELKTLADFESPYVQTGAAAANRSMDDAIIQAALSNVTITGVDQDRSFRGTPSSRPTRHTGSPRAGRA